MDSPVESMLTKWTPSLSRNLRAILTFSNFCDLQRKYTKIKKKKVTGKDEREDFVS